MTDSEQPSAELAPPADPAQPAPAAIPQPCARCGGFAPLLPRWGAAWCDACLRRRDPIELAPPTAWNLFRDTFALCLRIALPGLLLMFVFGSPGVWIELHTERTTPARMYDAFVGLFGYAAVQRLAFTRMVRPELSSASDGLRTAFVRYWSVWGAQWLSSVVSLLYALLLIVPGVLRALSYMMSAALALNEGAQARNALEASEARMRGHRGATFGALVLLGLAVFAP